MAVCLPINIVLPSFRGVLEAGQRFDVVNLVKITTNSLVFIVPFLGVILRSGLKGIVIFLVLSRAFALVAWILACRRAFPGVLKVGFLPRRDLKKMFVFGGWNTLSGVVWPILISLDRILLGARLGAQAVGFYVPPGEAVNKLGMIPGSLQLTLFPAFSLLAVQPRERKAKELFAKSLKYTILVLGPLVVIIAVFAKWILHLWLGDAFARTAAPVLQILAAGYLLQSLTYVPFSYLQGLGRADVTSIIQTVELVVIFPVFLLFIRWWGIAGAAAGVGFRSAFELVFLLSASWKRGGFDGAALAEEKAVVLVAALGGLAVWSMAWRRITDGLPGFFAVAAALVVYAVFSWARVLDSEERGRLRKLISAKQLS
jgi:O-antigen/teichoic acid export membrane protein